MYGIVSHACLVPIEAKRMHQIPWNWSFGCLKAALWAQSQILCLCNSSRCSYLLSRLSSFHFLRLFLFVSLFCFLTNSLYPLAITLKDLVIEIIFLCLHVVIRIMILSKFWDSMRLDYWYVVLISFCVEMPSFWFLSLVSVSLVGRWVGGGPPSWRPEDSFWVCLLSSSTLFVRCPVPLA